MEHRLRLAERQGLLRGDVNQPQYLGLELLMIADTRARHEDFADRLRIALVGAHPEMGAKLLPDWMGKDKGRATEDDEEVAEGIPINAEQGYTYAEEITDPEEAKRLLAEYETMNLSDIEQHTQSDWI